MRIVLVLSVVLLIVTILSACKESRIESGDMITVRYNKTCIDGVTYLVRTNLTVQVDREGKPVPCGQER